MNRPTMLLLLALVAAANAEGTHYYGLPLGSFHYSADQTAAQVYAADPKTIILTNFFHKPRDGCTTLMAGPYEQGLMAESVQSPNGDGVLLTVDEVHSRVKRQFSASVNHPFFDWPFQFGNLRQESSAGFGTQSHKNAFDGIQLAPGSRQSEYIVPYQQRQVNSGSSTVGQQVYEGNMRNGDIIVFQPVTEPPKPATSSPSTESPERRFFVPVQTRRPIVPVQKTSNRRTSTTRRTNKPDDIVRVAAAQPRILDTIRRRPVTTSTTSTTTTTTTTKRTTTMRTTTTRRPRTTTRRSTTRRAQSTAAASGNDQWEAPEWQGSQVIIQPVTSRRRRPSSRPDTSRPTTTESPAPTTTTMMSTTTDEPSTPKRMIVQQRARHSFEDDNDVRSASSDSQSESAGRKKGPMPRHPSWLAPLPRAHVQQPVLVNNPLLSTDSVATQNTQSSSFGTSSSSGSTGGTSERATIVSRVDPDLGLVFVLGQSVPEDADMMMGQERNQRQQIREDDGALVVVLGSSDPTSLMTTSNDKPTSSSSRATARAAATEAAKQEFEGGEHTRWGTLGKIETGWGWSAKNRAVEQPDLPLSRRGDSFVLGEQTGANVMVHLGDRANINDFEWFGIYDHCLGARTAFVRTASITPPRETYIQGVINGWAHGVHSGPINIINCNTMIVTDFTYIGTNYTSWWDLDEIYGDAHFVVGIGSLPDGVVQQTNAYVVGSGGSEEPLREYRKEDVMIRLPVGWKSFDINFISVYSSSENVSFGHTEVPPVIVPPCDNLTASLVGEVDASTDQRWFTVKCDACSQPIDIKHLILPEQQQQQQWADDTSSSHGHDDASDSSEAEILQLDEFIGIHTDRSAALTMEQRAQDLAVYFRVDKEDAERQVLPTFLPLYVIVPEQNAEGVRHKHYPVRRLNTEDIQGKVLVQWYVAGQQRPAGTRGLFYHSLQALCQRMRTFNYVHCSRSGQVSSSATRSRRRSH